MRCSAVSMPSAAACAIPSRSKILAKARSQNCRPIARRRRQALPPSSSSTSTSTSATTDSASTAAIPPFIPREFGSEVTEPAARDFISRMQRVALPVEGVSGALETAFVGPSSSSSSSNSSSSSLPPVVCLHGFDSSCLEFRRLEPLLAERGVECWCPDLVGWGFTSLTDYADDKQSSPSSSSSSSSSSTPPSLGPEEKRRHLLSFWKNVLKGRKMVLLGTSLGGGIAIDFAGAHPEAVQALVLCAPQAYAEGIGPLGAAPRWLARLGVRLLRSVPLRQAANKMAYYDTEKFATDDAMRVGRLHTHLPNWEEGNVAFMASGGYKLGQQAVRAVAWCPTLLVWGQDDKILDPALQERFKEDLLLQPEKGGGGGGAEAAGSSSPLTEFVSVGECGHCPHLEQPRKLAEAVVAFVEKTAGESAGES